MRRPFIESLQCDACLSEMVDVTFVTRRGWGVQKSEDDSYLLATCNRCGRHWEMEPAYVSGLTKLESDDSGLLSGEPTSESPAPRARQERT